MKLKSKLLRKMALTLALIITITIAPPVNAKLKEDDKVMKLTKLQVTEFALKNNVGMKRIDTGIDTLFTKLKETHELSDGVRQIDEALKLFSALGAKYTKLVSTPEYQKKIKLDGILGKIKALDKTDPNYEINLKQLKEEAEENMLTKKEQETLEGLALTKKEEATFKALKAEFEDLLGPEIPKFTKKDEYNMIVKPRDVIWYMVEGKIRQTKLLKESSTKKIQLGVNELYNGIVQMQEGYSVKKKLYDKQAKEYDQMVIRKKVGDASELQRIVAQIELTKLKLQLNTMERQIDNLELQLKKLMGIDMKKNIELTERKTDSDNIRDVKDYDVYLNDAISKRSEINSVKVDIDVNQWQLDKMEDYFYDGDVEYDDITQALEDAEDALEDAKKDVTKNIEFAYNDVMQKRREIDLARKKLDEMNAQYDAAYAGYKADIKPLTLTWTVEVGRAKAEFDLKTAIMNYNNAVLKLEGASTVGPKYETR